MKKENQKSVITKKEVKTFTKRIITLNTNDVKSLAKRFNLERSNELKFQTQVMDICFLQNTSINTCLDCLKKQSLHYDDNKSEKRILRHIRDDINKRIATRLLFLLELDKTYFKSTENVNVSHAKSLQTLALKD